jgi:hypothetical protein
LLWPSAALPGQGHAGTARAGDCSKISPCLNSQPGAPQPLITTAKCTPSPEGLGLLRSRNVSRLFHHALRHEGSMYRSKAARRL